MRSRRFALTTVTALLAALVAAVPAAAAPAELSLSEVRIDQPGADLDEYFELAATPGASLNGVDYVVIGDGTGGSGVVEAVVPLDGVSVPDDGVLVVAEGTFTLGTPDVVADLNFENSDNVTHLVVDGFTGALGDDLDGDDDGMLDSTPWAGVLDAVSLVEDPGGGERFYAGALGFTDLGPDGSFVPAHAYLDDNATWQIGDFQPVGQTDTPGVFPNVATPPPPPPTCDAEDITLISAVQGAGFSSPLENQPVVVEGAVTAVYPDLGGIAVQEEPIDVDDDPATSEGVFVFLGFGFDTAAFDRFDIVQVDGDVQERFGNTQISGDAVACDAEPVEITPAPLTLPADDATREALEGMLVVTTQDLTVTSLFTAYRFGELGVSPSGILREPTDVFEPGSPEAFALADANAQDLLFIDDRGEFGNANDPWFGEPGQRAGDLVEAGVTGVLVFSFGDYLLEPAGPFPDVVEGDVAFADRDPAPQLDGGNDLGAFNVLNYFNTFGDSEVLRGARNQDEFDVQSAKIVDAIIDLDAAVLGLVELENDYEDLYDGDPDTEPSIQTLVNQLNAVAGGGTYAWIEVPESLLTDEGLGGGGLGTDAIAVGIIYQPGRVTPVGDPATFDIDALLGGDDPDNNRWPLAHSFDIDGQVVTVVVNHFKSKGSTCDDTVVPPGFGDGQDDPQTASCDLVREYAAERLIEWVRTKPTGVNSPDTFVVGDLNAYSEEDPIRIFEDAGYRDLVERYGGDTFTFKFDGRYGRLDYVLASPSAKRLVDDTAVWHANAPEPYGYLYFNEPIDETGYASSDHDPVVTAISKPGRGPRR